MIETEKIVQGPIIGYKAMKKDKKGIYTDGNGYSPIYWKVGQREEIKGEIELGKRGFHFFRHLVFAINYFDKDNDIYEVRANGKIIEDTEKLVTRDLEIIRKIPKREIKKLIDTNRNSGDWNSGDTNSGNMNSGNMNSTDFSSGVFNSQEQKILIFNKPSSFTMTKWIRTDAHYITSRFELLDGKTYKESWVALWGKLTDEEKKIVMAIENFDPVVFAEITGVEVVA